MRKESSARELADLKSMLVDGVEHSTTIFKSVAASIGIHHIAAYAGAKDALANIRFYGPPDILFVKFAVDQSEPLQLCRFIRDRSVFPHPFLPIIAVMERATVTTVTAVRDAGVDEFLASPYSPRAMLERVQAILRDRRGFISVPGYFGPDRRRGAMAKYLGADRRGAPTEMIDPATEKIYIG